MRKIGAIAPCSAVISAIFCGWHFDANAADETIAVRHEPLPIVYPDFELQYRYKLIRVWELPLAQLLTGGLGTLPLAPISAVTQADLPAIIETMARRFHAEAVPSEIPDLWGVTRILMGLKWPRTVVGPLLKGVLQMKESDTYQEILEEGVEKGVAQGREQETRSLILRSGSKKFGPPGAWVQSRLKSIDDLSALEEIVDRLVTTGASSWSELLPPIA